ncbi:10022_t:CDS:2 [Gigaspora margarita]|uniref:10022_t:CDS:1 n=1 Tax=Gigaspora margarita TaxID=4874 RepID=A0ABM8VY31_GIGMA|nr:10022_t:CDS:2 [Gigaspora margarita]
MTFSLRIIIRKNPTQLEFVKRKLNSHIQWTVEILGYVNLNLIYLVDADSRFEKFCKNFNKESQEYCSASKEIKKLKAVIVKTGAFAKQLDNMKAV